MRSPEKRTRMGRTAAMVALLGAAASLVMIDHAVAEERKFVVMLAHSPKSFVTGGVPGLPPGGLADVEAINKEYFDRNPLNNIESFTEYWDEISYGDVSVTGETFGWVTLPWVFDPAPPNAPGRASPEDFINLRTGNMISENSLVPVPEPFAYGAGEDFCDATSSLDSIPLINTDKCGALIIIDPIGRPANNFAPQRAAGLSDIGVVGVNVWTPGERFIDSDGDNRWDSLDELNDRICHGPNGCNETCLFGFFCSISGADCNVNADCTNTICAPSVCSISGAFCDTSPVTPPNSWVLCPAGESCVVATGTCSNTGAFCATNAQCAPGVCQGVCSFTGVACVDRDDCPNPLETCVGPASERPCGGPDQVTCAVSGETCGDPIGSGPRGCNARGCGDLPWPWFNFDGNAQANNPSGDVLSTRSGCTIPEHIPCVNNSVCDPGGHLIGHPTLQPVCSTFFIGLCNPTNCVPDFPGLDLPVCCAQGDVSQRAECVVDGGIDIIVNPAAEGITCGTPIFCCEFVDADQIAGLPGDGALDQVEPFEDFMIRWNPAGRSPGTVWVRVDEKYVRDNYPGDVEGLIRRTGNGYYDPPDLFIDRGGTKMMQDAGQNQFAWRTPKPGQRGQLGAGALGAGSAYLDEQPWFEQLWDDRYGANSAAPPWPGGSAPSPPFNSPRMRPFDPANPVPAAAEPTAARRWFHPNRGGGNGFGRGPQDDNHWQPTTPFVDLDLGTEDPLWPILPEEEFGYYDGWVEHDDLPSSKYHQEGDKRLGEVTSPGTDTVTLPDAGTGTVTYTAVFGVDLGEHNSNLPFADPDEFNVAAGPYAVEIHGEKGFDAGDVCILEWLTWRRDGTSPTVGFQWEVDNGQYHPFAGPSSALNGGPIGFRDYNLDGMIDQGEVRPELSENYSVDSDPFTENDGTHSNYPFNRRRLVEDVVEALDPSVDWDDFNDANSLAAHLCSHPTSSSVVVLSDPAHPGDDAHNQAIDAEGFVSGIVLVSPGAYGDVNLFPRDPLLGPYFPIHNEDSEDSEVSNHDLFDFPDEATHHRDFNLHFHDLVMCQGCRSLSPAETPFAAHEYGHAWENFPDMYDYDVFGGGVDGENCPVGAWDLMGFPRGAADFVHPSPILKERGCTGWIDPVDLTTVLTPGVETTLTLPPAELVRDESYYFLENEERPGERYYFWSAGSGFDERLPGEGMLILHTDVGVNPEALPLQQNTAPWSYLIVQADGRGDLEACTSGGNRGDDGDIWPGSTGATKFNFDTNPPAVWYAQNSWTGLNISNVQPDGMGSVRVTLTWIPTNIPSLRFIDPPGGESVGSVYQVRFEATDVYGGTTIKLYYTTDPNDITIFPFPGNLIGTLDKPTTGTSRLSMDWNLNNLADGRYFIFAKLIPGSGADGTERKATTPVAGRNNVGNGVMANIIVDATSSDQSTARTETWTAVCIDSLGTEWKINSSLTQLEPSNPDDDPFRHAFTCSTSPERIGLPDCKSAIYKSIGGEVRFNIIEGSIPFTLGDRFTFNTTGVTATSKGVIVVGHRISANPTAKISASVLFGLSPLAVDFDATESSDPEDLSLVFNWDFGDGSTDEMNSQVTHTFNNPGIFTVVLTATNSVGRFGTATVDIIVFNNSPHAVISAAPTSGQAPLEVQFSAAGSSDTETATDQLIYRWDFGDGHTENNGRVRGISFRDVTHTYRTQEDGTPCTLDNVCIFNATLTVSDDCDGCEKNDTATIRIQVGNADPVAIVTASPQQGPAPLTVNFNAFDSSDADGDTLTVIWDFNDPKSPGPVELPLGGEDGNGLVRHTYTNEGNYMPTATVQDGHGGEAVWSDVTIVVGPTPPPNFSPTAAFTVQPADASGFPGDIFRFDASGSSDPETPANQLTYQWAFGDGNFATGDTADHAYDQVDEYLVRLTVTDERGESDEETRLISVIPTVNHPPVAIIATGPRTGSVPTSITFDGRTSFDPDGDPLEFSWDFKFEGQNDESMTGPVITKLFDKEGTYTVELEVKDTDDSKDRTDPETILITSRQITGDDDIPEPTGPGLTEPPPSANQRPARLCGFGMIMSFFGSLLGLLAMLVTRRHDRS